eukprot:GHVQ01037980.1.p1 GENE.GHVQ01037980.1~~GHVQ01037980.1.p1  ORF type:complete len:321 (-),score=44.93 GHVQ01037980.1:221-1183(-)
MHSFNPPSEGPVGHCKEQNDRTGGTTGQDTCMREAVCLWPQPTPLFFLYADISPHTADLLLQQPAQARRILNKHFLCECAQEQLTRTHKQIRNETCGSTMVSAASPATSPPCLYTSTHQTNICNNTGTHSLKDSSESCPSFASRVQTLSDFHLCNFLFCLHHRLTRAELSVYLSLMGYIHYLSFGPFRHSPNCSNHAEPVYPLLPSHELVAMCTDPPLPLALSFHHFKTQMLRHCHHRPPVSIGVFSLGSFKRLVRHTLDSFYRFYNLHAQVHCLHRVRDVCSVHYDAVDRQPITAGVIQTSIASFDDLTASEPNQHRSD